MLLKKINILALLLCFISIGASAQSVLKFSHKGASCDRWVEKAFAKGKIPPFSFRYAGIPSKEIITKWNYKAEKHCDANQNIVQRTYTYTDPKTGLEVKCFVKTFPEFNAMEWVLRFSNKATKKTHIIDSLKVVDIQTQYASETPLKLHYNEGSDAKMSDFQYHCKELDKHETFTMGSKGGRSSSVHFPYYNLESKDGGMIVAIGWSGNWVANIARPTESSSEIATSMKYFRCYLLPDEQIRTPMTAMVLWSGTDHPSSQNIFRRFVLKHHYPQIDGKPAVYPLCAGFNGNDPYPCSEYACLTEDYAIAVVNRYKQFGILPETFWLDAGWYEGSGDWKEGKNWNNTVGNWVADTKRFPNGLAPIGDAIHKVGSKFLVWFEPERLINGTRWVKEHPEYMLSAHGRDILLDQKEENKNDTYLFNLADEQAKDWLCKEMAQIIREYHIDHYRQDYNIDPEGFWYLNEAEDRRGVLECKYIEGLYDYWDFLRNEFPGLLVDNCASGGRRLDLEAYSRSAALWRTDYNYTEYVGDQCHTYGLNMWLPVHGTATFKTDNYGFRSGLSATLVYHWSISMNTESSIFDMQRCIAEFKAIRPYFYEDYYPLTGYGDMTQPNIWLAYQLLRPSDQSGYIVSFRRNEAEEDRLCVHLHGLDPDKEYQIENVDSKSSITLFGKQLMEEGYTIEAPKSSAQLFKYTQK